MTMQFTQVFEWHNKFNGGKVEVEDDKQPVQPTTSRTDENKQNM